MPRSRNAYLQDIIDACDTIDLALARVDTEGYLSDRVIRSAVEREFIIIGEAVVSLDRVDPDFAAKSTRPVSLSARPPAKPCATSSKGFESETTFPKLPDSMSLATLPSAPIIALRLPT